MQISIYNDTQNFNYETNNDKKKTTTNKSSGKKYVFYDPDDFWDYDEAEDYYDEL